MTVRASSLAVFLAVFLALVPAGAIAAGGGISPSCSPGNCSGWYRAAVTVQFVISPLPGNSVTPGAECGPYTQSSDTTGVTRNCVAIFTDSVGSTTSSASATVKKDSTPPVISGISARGPDANGWYNRPLSIGVNAIDATSGLASCNSINYSGPDTAGGSFSGTCTDNAGNSASGGSLTFKYDATPPAVSKPRTRRDFRT